MLPSVTVRKLLIDGRQWGEWQAYALPLGDEMMAVWTPAGTEMRWATGTFSATYNALQFWRPGARSVVSVHYLGAAFAGCYCDVVMPLPESPWNAPNRAYVDLYLDLVVREDWTWYTKDHEVYDRAEHAIPALRVERRPAEAALAQLEAWARDRSGPFQWAPMALPRTDWHLLDPASDELAHAVRALQV